jgi:hypothetical protein
VKGSKALGVERKKRVVLPAARPCCNPDLLQDKEYARKVIV